MKLWRLLLLAPVAAQAQPAPLTAQAQPAPNTAQAQTAPIIGSQTPLALGDSPPPAAPDGDSCMSVATGQAVSYACINQQQRDLVRQHRTAVAATVANPASPPVALGLYNRAATREHLGSAFGHAVAPPPTPPPVYSNPLLPH